MKHIHYLNNNIRKKHMYLKQHYCHLQKLIKMCTTSLVRFEKCKHHFEFPLWCSKHRTYHQLSEGNKCMSLKKILGASCYFTTSIIQKTKRSKEFWSPHSYDIGDHCNIIFNGSEKWSYLLLKIVRGVVCLMNVKYLYICKKYFFSEIYIL